jgi:hypothetical protein
VGRWRCLAPTAIARLNQHLRIRTWPFGCGDRDVRRLFIAGVATEYRVVETARDALRAGFEVVVLADAIRPLNPAAVQQAIRSLLYHHEGMEETAVFEFFARKLPAGRNFFVELAALNLAALPEPLWQLEDAPAYPVQIADSLRMLAQAVDAASGVLG